MQQPSSLERPWPRARALAFSVAFAALCAMAPGAAQAQEEPGPRDAHRALQLATSGSLIVTATLGTLVAINQPTLFGDGRCASGDPLLGRYGCSGLSVLHGLSALLSTMLYTATVTLEIAEFDWPGRDRHGTLYEVASYGHLVGMALQPIGGIIAAMPQVLGIEDPGFSRVLRTLHIGTGYAIVGTYLVTAAIEF
jgi:hypothetical protein